MAAAEVHGCSFFNEDCVAGARAHVRDGSVDLVVTDPPYGIEGASLHKHYNRDERFVVDGYVDVPAEEYGAFTHAWVGEAARVLRPGGSLYVVSGWSNLHHVLDALRGSGLEEINHLVWKFNFGVFTRTKYVSSHYHILYWAKPGGRRTFHAESRFGLLERDDRGGSPNYRDREDVWDLHREYKPGQRKNKNELPTELLVKMLQYSSDPGDLVADFFLGGFGTARVALGLGRRATGFELSASAFAHGVAALRAVRPGELLPGLRQPERASLPNQRKPWTPEERAAMRARFEALRAEGSTKKDALATLGQELGRGRWALEKALKRAAPRRSRRG